MSASEEDLSEVTIRDLINMYGREAVRRGLSYMESLSDAEENFKRSVEDEAEYAEEYADEYVDDPEDIPPEKRKEINERWAEGMKKGGLGLDDE